MSSQLYLHSFIVGFELAYASSLIGEHAALFIHTHLLQEGSQEPEQEINRLERPSEAQEEPEELYGNDELNEVVGDKSNGQSLQGLESSSSDQSTPQMRHPHRSENNINDTADLEQAALGRSQAGHTPAFNIENGNKQLKQSQGQEAPAQNIKSRPSRIASLPVVTIVCAVFCVLLTVLWIVLAIVDSERKHAGRRQQWFALLFAPFGCILRWLLSKLNTMQHRPLPWFPAGTFAANMIACAIDFIIAGITNRYTLGYWPSVILFAIRVGYAGSLSTVSTFIAEVRLLATQLSTPLKLSTQLHVGALR